MAAINSLQGQNKAFLSVTNNSKTNKPGNEGKVGSGVKDKGGVDEVVLSTKVDKTGFDKYVEEMEGGRDGVVAAFFDALGKAAEVIADKIAPDKKDDESEEKKKAGAKN